MPERDSLQTVSALASVPPPTGDRGHVAMTRYGFFRVRTNWNAAANTATTITTMRIGERWPELLPGMPTPAAKITLPTTPPDLHAPVSDWVPAG